MCCSPRAEWPTESANRADRTGMLCVLKDDGDDTESKHLGSVPPNGCIFRVNGIVRDGDDTLETTVLCEEELSIGFQPPASTSRTPDGNGRGVRCVERELTSIRPPVYTRHVTFKSWLCGCVLAGLGL